MEKLRADKAATLNRAALHKLPAYKVPPTYRVDGERNEGSGCAGDPPGFPSYYLRSVWTQYGNHPGFRNYPQEVIKSPWDGSLRVVLRTWGGPREQDRDAILRRLWAPLPLDHERTRAWIVSTYRHFRHCYQDPAHPEKSWHDRTLIYPVPGYKLATFRDDPRFSDDWRAKEQAAIDQKNREIIRAAQAVAVDPLNHQAVILIRRYYPDYEPEPELIANPPEGSGSWWERLARRPEPEECPGYHDMRHPVNGAWCQVCGWKAPEEAVNA